MIHVDYQKKVGTFQIEVHQTTLTSFDELVRIEMELWSDELGFQHVRCPCSDFQKRLACDHLDLVMTSKQADASSLSASVGVPMFHKPRLVIPCLVLPRANSELSKVQVVWGHVTRQSISASVSGAVEADGAYTLGYVRRKVDGRATLRRMLAEWLCVIPALFSELMKCEAATHTLGDSTVDEGVNLSGDPAAINKAIMVDAFQLLDTRMCRKCADAIWIDNDPPF